MSPTPQPSRSFVLRRALRASAVLVASLGATHLLEACRASDAAPTRQAQEAALAADLAAVRASLVQVPAQGVNLPSLTATGPAGEPRPEPAPEPAQAVADARPRQRRPTRDTQAENPDLPAEVPVESRRSDRRSAAADQPRDTSLFERVQETVQRSAEQTAQDAATGTIDNAKATVHAEVESRIWQARNAVDRKVSDVISGTLSRVLDGRRRRP